MGRKNRRPRLVGGDAPLRGGPARRETGPLGDTGSFYRVVLIPAQRAAKAYRCPGCDQEIARGVAHVVAWPEDDEAGEWRRHWHSGCWTARATRSITRRWS
ncbi:ATP/GTP-binding protein [Dietzia sp.]|uniref:ATP/GTP-binding protein n=1 Tax=Dietzia sp. TaxID=1871616 RepID=UPI002FD9C104